MQYSGEEVRFGFTTEQGPESRTCGRHCRRGSETCGKQACAFHAAAKCLERLAAAAQQQQARKGSTLLGAWRESYLAPGGRSRTRSR